ncbi:MAG: type II toxin-antitoxin system VapC family toxin [Vitreimonas sp.]
MILLDTNVISEIMRPAPSRQALGWLDRHFARCAISSVTVLELRIGVALLPSGKRRDDLGDIVARAIRRFGPRIYSFDAAAATAAAAVMESARAAGRALHQREKFGDLQIAGIAVAYGLQLATRNVADFEGVGLTLTNPWETV